MKAHTLCKRFHLRRSFALLALLAAGCGAPDQANVNGEATSVVTQAETAQAPVIEITPNEGHYHDPVVIRGQGFGPNEQVSIYWNTHPFFAGQTDSSGSFAMAPHPVLWFAMPGSKNTIKGTGMMSRRIATTTFTLLP